MSEEKAEAKDTKLEKKVNDLEAKVRKLIEWKNGASANWKKFCAISLGASAKDGKLDGWLSPRMALGLAMCVIAVVAFAATTIVDNKVGPEGANFAFKDVSGVGTLEVKGGEGDDAVLILDADEGDDNADTWTMTSTASGNSITLKNHTTTCLTVDTSGNVTAAGTLTGVGASSVSNLTVSGTLGVTGVATFTAESVHNAGIDADYLTVDAGAGVDCKAAGALKVGVATATSVDVGVAGTMTTVKGTLNVDQAVTFDTTLAVAGAADLNAASTATNITMDTGSTLAAAALTVASTADFNAAVTATNVTMDAGAKLIGTTSLTLGSGTETVSINSSSWDISTAGEVSGMGAIGAASITLTGDANLNGNLVGDNNTVVTGISNVTLVAGAELSLDGKYPVVGGDATTGLMVLKGTFTNKTATVSFATVFGGTPVVICGWNEDLSAAGVLTNTAITAVSGTASNFVPKTALAAADYTNCYYIAVGTRP